jgi:hypothetical protein
MLIAPQPIVHLLERIDRHPRLDTLCHEFDNAVAKAFRRDVRSLGWLLRSCPDLMSRNEIREALRELRKRYLVVPSEFQDLIDRAMAELERLPGVVAPETPESSPDPEELLDFAR